MDGQGKALCSGGICTNLNDKIEQRSKERVTQTFQAEETASAKVLRQILC